jgi:hypothetical protein
MEGKVDELTKQREEVKAQRAKLVAHRTSLEVRNTRPPFSEPLKACLVSRCAEVRGVITLWGLRRNCA